MNPTGSGMNEGGGTAGKRQQCLARELEVTLGGTWLGKQDGSPTMVEGPAATGSKHLLCSSHPISSGLWRTSVLLGCYNSAFMTLLAFLICPEHLVSHVSHCPRLSPEPITGQCRQPVLAGLLPPVQIAMACAPEDGTCCHCCPMAGFLREQTSGCRCCCCHISLLEAPWLP